ANKTKTPIGTMNEIYRALNIVVFTSPLTTQIHPLSANAADSHNPIITPINATAFGQFITWRLQIAPSASFSPFLDIQRQNLVSYDLVPSFRPCQVRAFGCCTSSGWHAGIRVRLHPCFRPPPSLDG